MRSVRAFYNRDENAKEEWSRLVSSPYRSLEFETTMHFLECYLPQMSCRVLDAGGGPGRYTVELVKRGYNVTLFDLAPANLVLAQKMIKRAGVEEHVDGLQVGSVDDMSVFEDGNFDAVLCLGGVLSHIVDRRRRQRALLELTRVCKTKGVLFVSVIGKTGAMVIHLVKKSPNIARPLFKRILTNGDYYGGRGFTAQHMYIADELERDTKRTHHLDILQLVGLEGISSGHEREVNEIYQDKKMWKAWMQVHWSTCADRLVASMSEHM